MRTDYLSTNSMLEIADGEGGPGSGIGGGDWKFDLPPEYQAHEPPEARGLTRDGVRLMVSYRSDNRIVHSRFREIGDFLTPGDLFVINTSGTMNAAIDAARADGTRFELHLSTHLHDDIWTVELRRGEPAGTKAYFGAVQGEVIRLPEGGTVTLLSPYPSQDSSAVTSLHRLWVASVKLPYDLDGYLQRNGFPIRYGYVHERWPIEYYQTVYATEVGSAEMPSAGRPFTAELITRLVAKGVQFAPLLLHTGVASLESNEPPYEEFYHIPEETARRVNTAHPLRKRVIAVGTTVIRALESATDVEGTTFAGQGWTGLFVSPRRGVRAVNGLLTGFHEPRSTHLAMLEALAGREHLRIAYSAALEQRYLWHEFGDLHLILP